MKLEILDRNGKRLASSEGDGRIEMVYPAPYRKGDRVVFRCGRSGWYLFRPEDTLPETLVYVKEKAEFVIPFGRMARVNYPPRSFKGRQHFLSAAPASPSQAGARRNLALNPLDQHGGTGMWPHAHATTETRNEALFAARNAIDGIHANSRHFPYPYGSWGINKDPSAALTVDFAVPVTVDELVLTLRADFPHDSYWTKGTVVFSDGSREKLTFEKSAEPQHFTIPPRTVTGLTLGELIKAEDESPYPALRQIEVWGTTEK